MRTHSLSPSGWPARARRTRPSEPAQRRARDVKARAPRLLTRPGDFYQAGMNRADARHLPLTPEVVGQHLRGGVHIGLYPLGDDDTCWWVAADFDKEAAMLDALAYMKAARER